jgi:hypothetical protein
MSPVLTLRAHAVKEANVLKQVKEFFKLHGWRVYRMDVGAYNRGPAAGYSFGEPGCPDLLCIYYLPDDRALILWVEVKSPGDRRKCRCRPFSDKPCNVCRQEQWAKTEELRGGMVIRVDDLRWLEEFYGEKYGWLHGPHGPRKGQTALPL